MTIAGTGGSLRDGIRPYPHFFCCNTRFALGDTMRLLFLGKICGLLLGNTGTMCRPYPARAGDFGHRKSGDSHINPVGSYSKRLNH